VAVTGSANLILVPNVGPVTAYPTIRPTLTPTRTPTRTPTLGAGASVSNVVASITVRQSLNGISSSDFTSSTKNAYSNFQKAVSLGLTLYQVTPSSVRIISVANTGSRRQLLTPQITVTYNVTYPATSANYVSLGFAVEGSLMAYVLTPGSSGFLGNLQALSTNSVTQCPQLTAVTSSSIQSFSSPVVASYSSTSSKKKAPSKGGLIGGLVVMFLVLFACGISGIHYYQKQNRSTTASGTFQSWQEKGTELPATTTVHNSAIGQPAVSGTVNPLASV
jgi:cytoskeletal protein RodZ